MMSSSYHLPVLLNACIEGLAIRPDGVYVDVTYGGGGHSKAILEKIPEGKLFAFDRDADAQANKVENENLILIDQDFRYMQKFLRLQGVQKVDGILADLGVSSHQIDTPERGFSTRFDGELDMRMDREASLSAYEVVNEYSEEELIRIFKDYGELRNAYHIARAIISSRPIATTAELKQVVEPRLKGKKIKELSKLFQAIRIEVNGELESLKAMLEQSAEVLNEGGRLVVISYHSLEDRLVKHFIQAGNFTGELVKDMYGNVEKPFKKISRKPIVADEEEVEQNPRARSAKLRIAERI